jgi:hypothetical protein
MRLKAKGINVVRAKLATGDVKTYYYHRATGTRLQGVPGSAEFLASYATAERGNQQWDASTLAGLLREFESTKQWRRLAESTKREYRRVFKFWDSKYGTCPYRALEDKAFRADVIKWHDQFSEEKPREADNRVTILARVLSWAAKDGPLNVNVLDGFERAYASNRSEIIWLPEHIHAFLGVASPEMQIAMVLALHTLKPTYAVWPGVCTTVPRLRCVREKRAASGVRLRSFAYLVLKRLRQRSMMSIAKLHLS